MIVSSEALELHKKLRGKIAVQSKLALTTKEQLSLAYTPGVSQAVKAIVDDPKQVFKLTIKHNTVAVVTDGSAVLGLGNVGAEAAMPVMEGKCMLFKEFAGIDAFPLCLKTQNNEEIINIIANISPIFGGINIEDISAPRCFEIEEKLQNLGIPVMHDDQHATAIVVLAALYNATKIVGKELKALKVVVVGSGAAGVATIKLLSRVGIKNILAVDSKGIISKNRKDLNSSKRELVVITDPQDVDGDLQAAAINADVLIGVSTKGLFTQNIVKSMNPEPIIFAMANPDPEILPIDAKRWGVAVIGTGRSDFPNQINNALVFPGFFKGLLENRITKITPEMKIKAAKALAGIIPHPTANNFIPSILDKRVVPVIAGSLRPPPSHRV
ncbi:NADP-dependent malic enzyme [Candidatus Gottesmanbacteria bacterium]|nr:NADP-dependent malic enzyme [Candidatus Gottesmanbacteria bacterium]